MSSSHTSNEFSFFPTLSWSSSARKMLWITIVSFVNFLPFFVVCQTRLQVNELTPDQVEDLEQAYARFVRKSRVQSTDGSSSTATRSKAQRSASPSQTDIQNDRRLAYAEMVQLGTVNFNRKFNDVVRGDVFLLPGEEDRTANRTDQLDSRTPRRGGISRRRRTKRKAINTVFNLVEKWDDGKLKYRILANAFNDPVSLQTKIRDSLRPIEERSCIRFEEIPSTQPFPLDESIVDVQDRQSCASVIGRVPGKSQAMSLASGCHVTGTIQHEFLHALGFGHEHERPDRDGFVAINSKYILSQYIRNFDKEPAPTYSTDIPYDLSSIMHYSQNQFSIDTSARTIELRDPYLAMSALDIGQRIGFSWLDEVIINKYYNCDKDCSIPCNNGGYVRKLTSGVCSCVCPPGLGGTSCEQVANPCGRYVDLSQNRQQVITSQNFDGVQSRASNSLCYFFIKGPGYIELEFSAFDVKCDNYLEIRSFHISQPALGLCGSTEPAPVKTILSPTPGMMMLVYDTQQTTAAERGWSLTATSHTDACLRDPCHGAKCTPVTGSDTQYSCLFPSHALHCDFEEGLLGACSRVTFNKYYQEPGDFQMAWQVSSNNNPHMLTSTDVTSRLQRGIASIMPHHFTGKKWCFSFHYRIDGDDRGTLNVHLVKNGQMSASTVVFTITDDKMSFSAFKNIEIDGMQYTSSDMVELVFETLYTDQSPGLDTVHIDNIHLVPSACPAVGDPCASFLCGDRECANQNNAAVCTYPDTDIHCGFEGNENGCQGEVDYFGGFHSQDNADWTLHSGPTLTPNTGPNSAAVGNGYIYVESNFPPSPGAPDVRTAFFRLAPRKSANRCLSFHYHMFGSAVVRLEVRAAIYDSVVPGVRRLFAVDGNQGSGWKFAQIDVDINNRRPDVKIQVEIIAKGRSKFSDIAIDDIHFTKGQCVRGPVNGQWGEWSAFGDCSVTCGSGTKTRSRTCTPPINGGSDCVGSSTNTASCQLAECPTDGRLTEWSAWSSCSATCEGVRTRSRECIPPQAGGQPCPSEDLEESEQCGSTNCPVNGIWQAWTSWSGCSTTCGNGEMKRERECTQAQHGGITCSGPSEETRICNPMPCPDAVVGEWGDWSGCSKTCGSGVRTRERECVTPATAGGITCQQQGLTMQESCNQSPCPIDAVLSDWSSWSQCSVTCDGGVQNRQRTCEQEAQHGGKPCSDFTLSETQDCGMESCTDDGTLSDWTEWSLCSTTCDAGQQVRTRTCTPAGLLCQNANLEENRPCTNQVCPNPRTLSPWTQWSDCSVTCGAGEQTRTRACLSRSDSLRNCGNSLLEQTQTCSLDPCPVNGQWSDWGEWTCSVTCGTGVQERRRSCVGRLHGGLDCNGDDSETKPCQAATANCPVDAIEGPWGIWGACSVTCGVGIRIRSRTCTPPQFGGRPCGQTEEEQSCNRACPSDGIPSPWSRWTDCSVTCGNGTKSRTRTCSEPTFGGRPCNVPLSQTSSCIGLLASCEISYHPWQNWGSCSKSCGEGGIRTRRKTCRGLPLCNNVPVIDRESCNEDIVCPVDGFYRQWQNWGSCSVTCGRGIRRRTRECVPPVGTGQNCQGDPTEVDECTVNCSVDGDWEDWTQWSQCSVSCGPGSSTRSRNCRPPRNGGADCPGNPFESRLCELQSCQTNDGFTPWSAWTSCPTTTTCPSPRQLRTRRCQQARCPFARTVDLRPCNPDCEGGGSTPATTTSVVTTSGFVNGEWSQWTAWSNVCPESCQGSKTRTRACDSPAPSAGGRRCEGSTVETAQCSDEASCNQLTTGQRVCEGFEGSNNIQTYGRPSRAGRAFRIQTGPAPSFSSNGRTGPGGAAEGSNYLLLSTNSRFRQEFQFITEFNFENGACIQFSYNTHGSSWQGVVLSISLLGVSSGRYSQAMWQHTAEDNSNWQTARFSVPSQQLLFKRAQVVLAVSGGGRFSDLGFDDLQMASGSCARHSGSLCVAQETPSSKSCGFEEGDDCSWVNTRAPNQGWVVWSGPLPGNVAGPTQAASGSKYIFSNSAPSILGLSSLPRGEGCLELQYMISSRQAGRLLITMGNSKSLVFGQFRSRSSQWQTQRVSVNILESSSQHQLFIEHRIRRRRTLGAISIDNISYRAGASC